MIWSPTAVADLVRLRNFIALHNPDAARRAAESLKKAARLLAEHPGLGKRLEGRTDRELMVPFGQRGYALRYRLEGETVVVLKIWHSLEDRTS
ncbi:MAG: type II toxin-antitoxin system RelE/ParE family toxin [Acidobacteria bacterium]|nr:type II toxin-antitoxin system RelE/ParE family toxin [Acidobacteriota bacterium]